MTRILFLDDEKPLVDYLPRLLNQRDMEVVATTSITEALERFAGEDFDIVLLDIIMEPASDMDIEQLDYGRETGVEIARRMKSTKPDVPIVAFTVLTDPEIQTEMKKAGVTEIINKPCEPARVADTILRVLRNRA